MKYWFNITFSILLFGANSYGQCDCSEVLNNIIHVTEAKYIGFEYKKKRLDYKLLKKNILQQSKQQEYECYQSLISYLRYFKDRHIFFEETFTLAEYKEKKQVKSNNIKPSKKTTLEGFWATDNNSYIIEIRYQKGSYNGYVIYSKLKEYDPGDLKVQFFSNNHNYSGRYFEKGDTSVVAYFENCTIKKDEIRMGLFTFNKITPGAVNTYKSKPIVFPKFKTSIAFNNNSTLLKIHDFSLNNIKRLDTIFRSNDSLIRKKKNLIIDLRNNYGGVTEAAFPLLKYLYTQPFELPGACYKPTQESITMLKEAISDTINYNADEIQQYSNLITRLIAANGKVVCDTVEIVKFDSVLMYPQNVAILINRKTLSAAEIFLNIARQSKKVKIFGEPSGGMVDFGWPYPYELRCKKYSLSLPIQTSTEYPRKSYEVSGVKPDIGIENKIDDWNAFVLKYYEKN